MINVVLLILILGVCLGLYHKVVASEEKTDRLIREVEALKKRLKATSLDKTGQNAPVASPASSDETEIRQLSVTACKAKTVESSAPMPPRVSAGEEETRPIPILAVDMREETVPEKTTDTPPPPPTDKTSQLSPPLSSPHKQVNYEKYIGENLFGKIGILILVVGMGLFVKYAIDKDWINETLRTILGFAVGGVLLFFAARLKDAYRPFSSLLAGGAFAVFYVTVAIAYHYYGLFSQPAAFVILVVLTVCMSALAVGYDRRELATIALVGGFVAPFLVSSGTGDYLTLFTYILILDSGMFALSLYKKWSELPTICFVFTWVVLGGYAVAADWTEMEAGQWVHLLIFTIAFYLIFTCSAAFIVRINLRPAGQLLLGILTVNNFVFLFFALWFLHAMRLTTNYNGAFTLFVALVNGALFCWIRRKGETFRFLLHTLLGITLAFISITIPIQLEGTFITLFWATETAVILWFYLRFRMPLYAFFGLLLAALTLVSFGMDIENVCRYAYIGEENRLFLNGTFATGLYAGAAFGAGAWLWERAGKQSGWLITAAGVVVYTSFMVDFWLYISPKMEAISYMEGFTTAVLAGLTAWLGRRRLPVFLHLAKYVPVVGFSVFLFVVFSYVIRWDNDTVTVPRTMLWISWILLAAHLFEWGRLYYAKESIRSKQSNRMIGYLSFFSTVWLAVGTNNLLYQLGWADEANAGFSVSLGVAGFILMALGMRLHVKTLRMASLVTFGLVLLKLGLVDLWLLPTIGKVVAFIILGVILLVLSFLYQKLKAVLFDNDGFPRS